LQITATIAANSVALGTDTTGNYVSTITASLPVVVSGSGTESATVNIELANSLATPGTYGSSTTVPVFTVNNKGIITAVTQIAVSGGGGGGGGITVEDAYVAALIFG
jgi:hypothetical protein